MEGVKFFSEQLVGNKSNNRQFQVKRVLIDNEALVDILFNNLFTKMGYNDSQLEPLNLNIYGFNGVESRVEGTN